MKKVYILFSMMIIVGMLNAQVLTRGQYNSMVNKGVKTMKHQKPSEVQITPRGTKAIYYSQDFNGLTDFPAGWQNLDQDGDGQLWSVMDFDSYFTTGNCAVSRSWTSGTGALNPDNYLVTEAIDLSSATAATKLVYYVGSIEATSYYQETYSVYVTSSNAVGDITASTPVVDQETLGSPEAGNLVVREIDLSAFVGGTVYVTFRHHNTYDMNTLCIDDIMVYEPSDYDGGVVAITSPSNAGGCALTASENVTVTIENFGANAISGFDVSYTINGGAAVTENVSTSIAAGATYDYTFTATADLSAVGAYEIEAYTSIASDGNSANDGTTISVANADELITVTIVPDDYGSETTWMITDMAGNTVAEGGPYTDGVTTPEVTNVCVLSSDCYTFTIFDAYGDGICCSYGNGSYTVEYAGSTTATGGEFASEESVLAGGDGCPGIDVELVSINTPAMVPAGMVDITGTIKNNGLDVVTSYDVTYTIDGGTAVGPFSVTGVSISTGNTHNFTHGTQWNATAGAHSVEVTIDNINSSADEYPDDNTLTKAVSAADNSTPRTIVFEEFSTEACPNCPPVATYIHGIEETESNMIMMVHHAGYYTDPYTITENTEMLALYNAGGSTYAPAGCADRFFFNDAAITGDADPGPVFWPGDPYGGYGITERLSTLAFVTVGIDGLYNPATRQIEITVSGEFLADFTGTIGISCWITEDGITSTDQAGYTGTWTHHFVVRDAISGTWGDAIATATTTGSTYSKTFNYTIDASWVVNNLEIVAFVNQIDAGDVNNREIHNASGKLVSEFPVNVSMIDDNSNIKVYPNPTNGIINIVNADNATITVYNVLGEVVATVNNATNMTSIDLQGQTEGTYLVKVQTENNVITRKFVLNK